MFLLPKNKYTKKHLKILQILLYTTSLWILCSLPSYIFKTKLELPLCLFFMILSYYLCLLFAEIYFFRNVFLVFLSLLLYLNVNFCTWFRFMPAAIVKARPSPSKRNCVVCFIENPLKMIKNAFYFMLKASFILKVFKFLSWRFGHAEKMVWLER